MRAIALLVLVVLTGCVTTGGNTVDKSKMAEGYYMKGLSYLQDKNYEMASVEFNRSIQHDKTYKGSYYGLGIINDYQGKLDEAAKYYQEAIDQDDQYSEAYNALGVVYSKQKKYKEAITAYNKALANKLYTTPHIPYSNLGDLYMDQKNYEKAAEAYRESKRFVINDRTILMLGTALFESGKIKEAIEIYKLNVDAYPESFNVYDSIGEAYMKNKQNDLSIENYKKSLELNPKNDNAVKMLEKLGVKL